MEEKNRLAYEILGEDYPKFDLSFKVIMIGDSNVGKEDFRLNLKKNVFEDSYSATIGFEYFPFNMRIQDKVIKLYIWDTCGQEIYRSLITNYYRNASLAIIIYAINE